MDDHYCPGISLSIPSGKKDLLTGSQDDIGGVQGDVKNVRGDMVFEVTGAGVVVGARVDPSTSLRGCECFEVPLLLTGVLLVESALWNFHPGRVFV